MNPLVSVVIPVYNCEDYIDTGLKSIFDQTYENLEVICVDNNSNIKTKEKLQEWQVEYPKLIVVEEKRQGAPYARNLGTSIAKGDWIQYFDIDDQLLPQKIEHQINLIHKNNYEVDFVSEGWKVRTLKGEEFTLELEEDVWKGMFNGRIGHTNSVLIRKSLVDKVGGWDVNLDSSQERDLFFRILKEAPRIVRSKEFNDYVVKRENSISTNKLKSDSNTKRYVELRIRILNYLIKNDVDSFRKNKQWYLNEIFRSLRLTYSIDKKWSQDQYELFKNHGLKLQQGNGISWLYHTLYKLFGFRLTEKIYQILGK